MAAGQKVETAVGAHLVGGLKAPDAETANTVHREAHGLVADEIFPVTEHA